MVVPVLELQQVSCRYGDVPVVQEVSLSLCAGEVGCLLGPSGCGKTTVLRAIAGLEPVTAGAIRLHGERASVAGFTQPAEQRRLGMVFQDHALFPHLTVAENVAFGIQRLPREARRERVEQCLAQVHLTGLDQRMPHELSGGQQQRVALARALAPSPQLILLDEPFASLDLDLRRQLNLELAEILRHAGTATLMVTHDHEQAFTIADQIGVMVQGRLQQWGEPANVYRYPASEQVALFIGLGVIAEGQVLDTLRVATVLGELPLAEAVPATAKTVRVLLRPEHMTLIPGEQTNATVEQLLPQGNTLLCKARLDQGLLVNVLIEPGAHVKSGDRVTVAAKGTPLTRVGG